METCQFELFGAEFYFQHLGGTEAEAFKVLYLTTEGKKYWTVRISQQVVKEWKIVNSYMSYKPATESNASYYLIQHLQEQQSPTSGA